MASVTLWLKPYPGIPGVSRGRPHASPGPPAGPPRPPGHPRAAGAPRAPSAHPGPAARPRVPWPWPQTGVGCRSGRVARGWKVTSASSASTWSAGGTRRRPPAGAEERMEVELRFSEGGKRITQLMHQTRGLRCNPLESAAPSSPGPHRQVCLQKPTKGLSPWKSRWPPRGRRGLLRASLVRGTPKARAACRLSWELLSRVVTWHSGTATILSQRYPRHSAATPMR